MSKSLLTLKKEPIPGIETHPTRLRAAVYKHYILIFDQYTKKQEDCIVFDTQKGTTSSFNTGMSLKLRSGFSLCYWKDNIFILYGGASSFGNSGGSGLFKNERHEVDVHFLKVIEKDGKCFLGSLNIILGQISFEVESCGLTDPEWWNTEHSAEIFQDNMYIFGQRAQENQGILTLKKFDLSN